MSTDLATEKETATELLKAQVPKGPKFRFDPHGAGKNRWFHCSRCGARVKHVFRLEAHARKHLDGTIKG